MLTQFILERFAFEKLQPEISTFSNYEEAKLAKVKLPPAMLIFDILQFERSKPEKSNPTLIRISNAFDPASMNSSLTEVNWIA